MTPEEQKVEELRQMIASRFVGYEVTHQLNIDDGWHFAMTKTASDRYLGGCILVRDFSGFGTLTP